MVKTLFTTHYVVPEKAEQFKKILTEANIPFISKVRADGREYTTCESKVYWKAVKALLNATRSKGELGT